MKKNFLETQFKTKIFNNIFLKNIVSFLNRYKPRILGPVVQGKGVFKKINYIIIIIIC